MSPVAARSASRSERTESEMPPMVRERSRNPAGPLPRMPRTIAVQRLPRKTKARARAASPPTQDVGSTWCFAGVAIAFYASVVAVTSIYIVTSPFIPRCDNRSEAHVTNGSNRRPTVLVVGGGYGGIRVAKALDDIAEVTLFDPKEAFVHNIAAWRALVDPKWLDRIFFPYERLLAEGRFLRGRATSVDSANSPSTR